MKLQMHNLDMIYSLQQPSSFLIAYFILYNQIQFSAPLPSFQHLSSVLNFFNRLYESRNFSMSW